MFKRYAVYVTPKGDLAAFGAGWLGWDIARGEAVDHPRMGGLDVAGLTQRPRRYGLHATIKPPFHLSQGKDAAGLRRALEDLCQSLPPVVLQGLSLSRLGSFLALVPVGDTAALNAMAAHVVERLDGFRAPPGAEELARRRKGRLNDRQERHLQDWGYPHVMDQFRFHITLTGRVRAPELAQVQAVLEPRLASVLPAPFVIDSLTLAGEDADGFFHEIRRVALCG